jgi:ABC-type multidrug transport system ATPase subunit
MSAEYLQFKGVAKQYGPVHALGGLDLAVDQGSVLGLLGPNGAGKSTLFGCLLGLTRFTTGTIALRGLPIDPGTRARMGYTPERVALYPNQSVWENGLFFVQLRGHKPAALEQQLKRVGLDTARHRKVRELSKGMLQRLGLAIALCGAPELILLDEPFNGLDPVWLEELRQILREEHRRGATLLISTHTISAIEPIATHIAILLGGHLAAFGALDGLRMDHPEAASLEEIYHQVARNQSVERDGVLAS